MWNDGIIDSTTALIFLPLYNASIDETKHNMTSLQTFPLFARLPYELRVKIYEFALSGPRIVPVRYNRQHKQYTSDAPPPVLLHVCVESRRKFTSIYERLRLAQNFESSIWVDFTRDTLFFDNLDCSPEGDLALDLARSPQSQKVLYCAIDAQLWEVLRVFRPDTLGEVKIMRNLKTFALVLKHDYDRGLRQTRMMYDGRQTIQVEVGDTGSEIQHVQFNVDSIRWDIEHETDPKWEGAPPNVQMWIM